MINDTTSEVIRTREQTIGNLLYLDLSNETCVFAQYDDIWLWHRRLCHVNFDNLASIKHEKSKRITKIEKT